MEIAWVSHMRTIALHSSLTFLVANHDHAQLKKGLNRRKSDHERLIKSYEQLRQEMQDLIAQNAAPEGAIVPNPLSSEILWDLDVDNQLWMDLAQDNQQQDDAPKWLYHQPTQQGIRAMLDKRRSDEELERLNHERGAMHTWLQRQAEQLQLAGQMAQGTQPAFPNFVILIQPTTRRRLSSLPDETAGC